MTNQQLSPLLDDATVERLADALHRTLETCEPAPDAFADDVFCDLLPPCWRFQVEGRAALAAQLRSTTRPGTTVRALRVVPAADGFVAEHEQSSPGDRTTARRLVLCEVREGRIAALLMYCNGPWDDELRARHAAEAPMLRT